MNAPEAGPPVPFQPNGLVSLWDMLEIKAAAFYDAIRILQILESLPQHGNLSDQNDIINSTKEPIIDALLNLEKACEALGARLTMKSVGAMYIGVRQNKYTYMRRLGDVPIKGFPNRAHCDSNSQTREFLMARFDLTDFEWSVIDPLLPNKPRGVPRVDDRRVLNGIFWRLRTGAPWADIPARYGPHTTCVNRFNRWRKAGVWDRLLDAISKAYDGDIQMIDSSSIRVHQHAANGKKKPSDPVAWVARGAA